MRRFLHDESGMTMGVAVMMIVLIGVMGAGLLTFVQRDLETVIEVNTGQKAFEMADAGVQLARQHIKSDPRPGHYDVDVSTNPLFVSTDCNVPSTDATESAAYVDGDWSLVSGGVTKSNLDGNSSTSDAVQVTIRFMPASAAAPTSCRAPVTSAATGTEYYRVISTGTYGNSKRKVEAIVNTSKLDIPEGFFTRDTFMITGNTQISNVSIFSTSTGTSSASNNTSFTGTDTVYKSWASSATAGYSYPNSYNCTARSTNVAGMASLGTITGKTAGRDFDGTTTPRFQSTNTCSPANTTKMTFPFDPDAEPQLDELKAEAIRQEALQSGNQGYYKEITNPVGSTDISSWPPDIAGTTTVVYYKLGGASTVRYSVPDGGSVLPGYSPPENCKGQQGISGNPPAKGIIVIDGGDFTSQPNKALFRGITIVRGGAYDDGDYADTGTTCMEGYANVNGNIELKGNVSPASTVDVTDTPGFIKVSVWSWRELYQ